MADYSEIQEISVADAKSMILAMWAGLDLPEDTDWSEGSIPAMVLEAAAAIWNNQSKVAVAMKGLTVGENATGDVLTLWSWSMYRHERFRSSTAIFKVRVTCPTGIGPYTLNNGRVVVASGTGQSSRSFRLIDSPLVTASLPYTITAGNYVDLAFEAEEPGSASGMVSPGSINRLVTTYVGLTVFGISLLSPGANEETDSQLRQRNSTWWTTRNALIMVRDAYVYYSRSANSKVRRVALDATNPRGQFSLDVIIAGDANPVGESEVADVGAALRQRMLPAIAEVLLVRPATLTNIQLQGVVHYYSDFDEAKVRTAIITELNALCADAERMPIGGSTFPGIGTHKVLKAQFEKAIGDAKVGDTPCISTAYLTSIPESVDVGFDSIVGYGEIVWGAGQLELFAVQR